MKPLLSALAALAAPLCLCAAGPAVTIYNQDFAVVRDQVPLVLKQGINDARYAGATLHLEPDSVILRDRAGKTRLKIVEQNYRGDVVSQGLLLDLFEGRTIDFLKRLPDGGETTIKGKIVRSGYASPATQHHRYQNVLPASPIIEVDGQLRFSLPGEPLFPTLGEDTILEPMLGWKLHSSRAAEIDAELSYITGGMSWQAAYNFVFPEKGDTMDVVGWVTLNNRCGKAFDGAEIKLIAGDVNKLQQFDGSVRERAYSMAMADEMAAPQVTEKAFDEFHLYTLPGTYTLRDSETKQVEFLRATGVKARTVYVYDGAAVDRYRGWDENRIRNQREFGTEMNKKVWVKREFMNTEENGLGMPLPAGRTRFYREDDSDGRPEFTGENRIDHTPRNEKVSIYTGDSFDLVGERISTDYQIDTGRRELFESFEITLRNRKKEAVEIRIAERLYRGATWEIVEKSDEFEKVDARNIAFNVTLKPDEERKVTYRVRYTW